MKRIIKKYGIYILISICLILGLSSLFFRNATLDDDLYLLETSIMTEAIKGGEWIGDYAVGTHGFLFKLPVALVFLLTGPSLEIATVWNVILASVSLYLFYLILKEYFKKEDTALIGTLLLLTSFQFLLHLPTYMREIPVLFSLLLFIYLLQKKKSYWIVGLSLALIFDAKEYVLLMLIPGIVLFILWSEREGTLIKTVGRYLFTTFKLFLPTLVLLLLMIFTRVVPVNIYAVSIIPGVTKGGMEYHLKHFDPDVSTINRIRKEAPSIQENLLEDDGIVKKVFNIVKSYTGKILYPRSFSFISIPKIVIFPAIVSSIFFFKKKLKKKDSFYLLLNSLLWSFLLVFFLRASFDRYLLPIVPVVLFFYIYFLKELIKGRKAFLFTVVLSGILAFVGLFFEVEYLVIKFVLNLFLLLIYLLYYLFPKRVPSTDILISGVVSCITLSVALFFFYANGQLRYYINFGKDYEIKRVVSFFQEDEKVLLNDVGWDILPRVYRGNYSFPVEWKMELADWVPRKRYLKMFNRVDTFGMVGKSVTRIRKIVVSEEIEKIGLVVSELDQYIFPYQDMLEDFKNQDWLLLDQEVPLKNKTLYIFEVKK